MSSKLSNIVVLSVLLFLLCAQFSFGSQKTEQQPQKKHGGKNILVYMGVSSYSMRISIWPLIEGLIENGHNVSFISAQEPKVRDPRVTDFVPKQLKEYYKSTEEGFDFTAMRKYGVNRLLWYVFPLLGPEACEKIYTDSEAVEWIRNSKFDLVMIDGINECGYGLAHYFKSKTVLYNTFTVAPWFYDGFGLSGDDSWVADLIQYFPAFSPTFISRTFAAATPVLWKFIRDLYYFPKLEKITRTGLGVDTFPSFRELEKNISLIFITTHYAQEYARSFPPNVIPIGGLALTGKVKPLPRNMEDFINKGKNGFIYISFGTVFDFSKLEQHQKDTIINALLQFPDIQFIWKATGGVGVDLPANFLVSDWVPQQDLLAHPKIKAFVTHSGLGSTNEAIYHGVPMLAFPVLTDQDFNANFLEPKGIGIKMEISTLTTEEFKDALVRITSDPKYLKNMKKVSKHFKDRPMTPVATALWWMEFVIRHDPEEISEFLQSRSIHQSWWVRRQLDVWLFLGVVAALFITIPIYVMYRLLRRLCGGSQKKKVKQH